MVNSARNDAQTLLREWADQERPQPSDSLHQLMGPLRRTPRTATSLRAIPIAARVGLGLKVLLATGALAISSAAAMGVTHLVTDDPNGRHPLRTPASASTQTPPGLTGPHPTQKPTTTARPPAHSGSSPEARDDPSPTGIVDDPSSLDPAVEPTKVTEAPGTDPAPADEPAGTRPTEPAAPTTSVEQSPDESASSAGTNNATDQLGD